MHRYIAAVVSITAISACGGSGGSVDQSVSFDTTPIRFFADDSGVARYTAVSGGEVVTGYISSPVLASVLDELEATGELNSSFELSDLNIVDSGPNTTIRTGAISVEGGVANILAAVTLDEDASLVLFEEASSGATLLQTAGAQVTNIPTGTVTYTGVLGLQDLVYDASPEIGTFAAVAGFDGTPSISLSGSTASYDVNGTALISGGSFSSASVTIDGDGFSVPASMNGDFHGNGANSVAGIIYSNDDFGEFRGGFVGSRD